MLGHLSPNKGFFYAQVIHIGGCLSRFYFWVFPEVDIV